MLMKRFLFTLILLVSFVSLNRLDSQTIPVNGKFGKVSDEEVTMTVYDKDTSAVALILYDNEYKVINFDASGSLRLHTEKRVRIKVLKEDGVSYGDFSVVYYGGHINRESVSGIEAVTYNMVDGKVVETKMPKKLIFNEPLAEDYFKISWSAQDVKVGSVIECKWNTNSEAYWDIDDIYFQRTVPVNLVEVTVKVPDLFTFNRKMKGYHPIEHTTNSENTAATEFGNLAYSYKIDNYVGRDVPAFKREPFVYNSRQYMNSVHYDIRSLMIPGVTFRDFSVTWSDVDKSYLDSDMMSRFKAGCQFKDEMDLLMPSWEGKKEAEKIASVVELVNDNVVWDEVYRIIPDLVSKTVKARSGSNVDKNCLIASCLRYAGYQVEPVLVKMRSSGMLMDFQPERNAFDTFILRVVCKDGSAYYLDGGCTYAYVNVLSDEFLVPNARILREGGRSEWVDLTSLGRNSMRMTVQAKVTPDFRMEGTVSTKAVNEDAFNLKDGYHSFDSEEDMINDMENEMGLEIIEYAAKGMDDYSPSAEESYTFTKDLDATGDIIYVNPFLDSFHSKDAFQSLTRDYPIDFPYAYTLSYVMSLEIPEGYVVDQMPESGAVLMPHIGGTLRTVYQLSGNRLMFSYTFNQKSMMGNAADYADIRSYWQYLGNIYDSVIVLKKI